MEVCSVLGIDETFVGAQILLQATTMWQTRIIGKEGTRDMLYKIIPKGGFIMIGAFNKQKVKVLLPSNSLGSLSSI